jgi:hypothetical protein
MSNTEEISFIADPELLQRIKDWMTSHGKTLSREEAIRQLVSIGLSVSTGYSIRLSDGDKLNFSILRDIAKHLDVETDLDLDFMSKTIHEGHYWAPTQKSFALFNDSFDSKEDVEFVFSVLTMWQVIEEHFALLPEEEKQRVRGINFGKAPEFDGFDGNNEHELMGIAEFIINDMNRYPIFHGRTINSHHPSRDRAERMLTAFRKEQPSLMKHQNKLTADQIISLIEAGWHPSHQ